MSDQAKPTAEDYSHDLHADLAIAEAATPGPWTSAWDDIDLAVEAEDGTATMIATAEGDQVMGTQYYDGPRLACKAPDARAIASNRLAAPAAMRRAIEAEDMILAWSRALSDPLEPWQDGGDYADRVDEACDRMVALADRIRAARNGGETP